MSKLDQVHLERESHNPSSRAFATNVVNALYEFTKSQLPFPAMGLHGLSIARLAARMPWGVHPISISSSTSRNLWARADGVYGFCRSATPGSNTPLMDNRVLGIGRGEKNLGMWKWHLHAFGQFLAAHLRHRDIGEQQIDMAGIALLLWVKRLERH